MKQKTNLTTRLILAFFIAFAVVIILFFAPQPTPPGHYLGIFPAEARVNDLAPGNEAQFELTIYNNDAVPHSFTFSAYHPRLEERRADRAAFPDSGRISFSPEKLEIAPGSGGTIAVNITIPRGEEYAGRDYEIWLGTTTQSEALVTVRLYARLLVSTTGDEAG
jgi:hypothetical protein